MHIYIYVCLCVCCCCAVAVWCCYAAAVVQPGSKLKAKQLQTHVVLATAPMSLYKPKHLRGAKLQRHGCNGPWTPFALPRHGFFTFLFGLHG